LGATYANFSNFFGFNAGYGVTGIGSGEEEEFNSNFFGKNAGYQATNAINSNFLGQQAGGEATNAEYSNFLGAGAGRDATNAINSNFLGQQAGYQATNANNSNFFGQGAGEGATNANNSIFIGQSAGSGDTVDNSEDDLSSILIGSFTNTGGFSNSILLGSGTSVSPIANTKENQFMLADTITDVRWSGIEYTLPDTQAANAGDVLSNDGTGVLSWATAGTLRGLFAQTANSTPVTATTVETTLINGGVGTLTVPANGFQVGDSFRAVFGGVLNAANNQTIRIRVKAGSVILLDSGAQAISNITSDIFSLNLDFTIRQLGAAGVASIVSLGGFHYTKTNNGTVEGFAFNTVNSTTFDTTISNTLDVTVQWGSNNAGNSIYSDIFILNRTY
jgi:extradiol dioxygenase family protein